MDSLHETDWDVVIAGTGLRESLLALALSTSGKKVLHVDKNHYYGGPVTALNPQDAEAWVDAVNKGVGVTESVFSSASIINATRGFSDEQHDLGRPRQYNLALSPAIFYAKSPILNHLVDASLNDQIDFVADGNTWVFSASSQAGVRKVPSSREDIIDDSSVSPSIRRRIIKFLRFVGDPDARRDLELDRAQQPFDAFLDEHFGLSPDVQMPIHALTMSPDPPTNTLTTPALRRIETHLRNMNILQPGIASVTPKWGGLAEIVQVMCRAQAVAGGVYVLGRGLQEIQKRGGNAGRPLRVELGGGNVVYSDWVVSGLDNTPTSLKQGLATGISSLHNISIVSRPLEKLFERPEEDSVDPSSASVCVMRGGERPPIHIIAHGSDTGDCPPGKCILYAQTAHPSDADAVTSAVSSLVASLDPTAEVLWRLRYERRSTPDSQLSNPLERVFVFAPRKAELVFDDDSFGDVREVWSHVVGAEAGGENGAFMVFPARREQGEESSE